LVFFVAGNADEGAEIVVATPFREAGFEGDVAEHEGEEHDAPEDGDEMVVAAVAACLAEAVEQGGVGDGSQEASDRSERGAVVEGVPGEEGLDVAEVHGELSLEKV
jgi:hypothetical protein